MAWQYLIIGPGPKNVQGSNVLVDAQSYQSLQGYTVIDATGQNVLTNKFDGINAGGAPLAGTQAILQVSLPAPGH